MKHKLICVAALAFFSFGKVARTETIKVVCFGDSITNRGYFDVLAELLDVTAVNAGKGGHSSAMGLRRIKSDVFSHDPDVVVILFGTNDLRADSKRVFVPVEKYKANLHKMIALCRDHDSKVVLCTLPPINEQQFFTRHDREPFTALGGLQVVIQSYRNAARDVAKETKTAIVDLNKELATQPEWLSKDGVHPSTVGTKLIAEHVSNAIEKLGAARRATARTDEP